MYLKGLHNDYHAGCRTAFLEVYAEVPEWKAQWHEHARKNKITARSCPIKGENTYANRRFRFLNGIHKQRFKNQYHFMKITGFVTKMEAVNAMDMYKATLLTNPT